MLKVENISFAYFDTPVVRNISFTIQRGQHIAIIGESGCGKSTLLQLIYGLFDLDQGTIFWENTQVLGPSYHLVPGESYMKYLAQDFDLMPFTTAAENINTFLSRFYPEESKKRTNELLEVVEMTAYANTKVKYLSGGQKQRIALAKAIAKEPQVLLLDEPFSHIDNHRKNKLRRQLFSYLKSKNITCIVATHDTTDVLSFTDETLVMKDGILLTQQPTLELYHQPSSIYIASLFDEVNELPAYLFDATISKEKTLLVYPHELTVTSSSNCKVTVLQSYFKGSHYYIEALLNSQRVFFTHPTPLTPQSQIYLTLSPSIIQQRLA